MTRALSWCGLGGMDEKTGPVDGCPIIHHEFATDRVISMISSCFSQNHPEFLNEFSKKSQKVSKIFDRQREIDIPYSTFT
jgi:hypothetical protein